MRLIDRGVSALVSRLPERNYPYFIPYHGNAHWSFTHNCVGYILKFIAGHPDCLRFHKHSFIPDETFFHSIVKASPFSNSITQDFERGYYISDDHYANHYMPWSEVDRGLRPDLTLIEGDLDTLLSSKALFARKFNEIKSKTLLEAIDAYIRR